MALIGKIRKNFWFVLILLGLALAAFILMDMTSGGPAGGAATSSAMGSVAGQQIDYREFSQTEQAYYANAPGDAFTKRKNIWDFYVEKAILDKEAGALGLNVSKNELRDLQFGPNPSQIIRSNFSDPATGQFNQPFIQSVQTAIDEGTQMDPRLRAYWAEQEKQIVKDGVQSKLNNLISKSVYTPNWMAEESFKLDNTKVDFSYVKIPFDNMDGTGVDITDADLLAYAKSKNDKYIVNEETREIEYATFEVYPTSADTAAVVAQLGQKRADFLNAENDSLWVLANNGQYTHLYAEYETLPAFEADAIAALSPGEVHGPFSEEGIAMMVKMIDKRSIPDSVKARHILVAAAREDVAGYAAAVIKIDSIRRAYRNGSSFESLAANHSDDASNSSTGGDLPMASQQNWVPEFTEAAFKGTKGGLYTVKTQFGVHLLEVERQVFGTNSTKYRLASVAQAIVPSQGTQDAVYDKVTEILTANKDINSLRTALNAVPEAGLIKSTPLKRNDFNLGNLGQGNSSREIISWAFDPSNEPGDVSPEIYKFRDPVNYFDGKYVIASLSSIYSKGMKSASTLRNEIAPLVMNRKKAQKFVSGLSYNSLQELASAHGLTVETASDVGSKSSVITGIGKETEVLAAAISTDIQAVSQPVIGETGVFVLQPLSRQEAGAPTNIPLLKNGLSQTTKSQVNFSIIKNMIKKADIKDDRSTFF